MTDAELLAIAASRTMTMVNQYDRPLRTMPNNETSNGRERAPQAASD